MAHPPDSSTPAPPNSTTDTPPKKPPRLYRAHPPTPWEKFNKSIDDKLNTVGTELDKNRLIYLLFAFTSISDARNIINLIFNYIYTSSPSTSDRMHEWLMSPIGIAVATIETTLLLLFAILGSYFDEAHPNRFIRKMASTPFIRGLVFLWPYVRDSIKALKNGYNVSKSILYIGLIFGASALVTANALLPLGILLGVSYLASRVWYRHMCSDRKKMQSLNGVLGKWNTLSTIQRQEAIKKNALLHKTLRQLIKDKKIENETTELSHGLLLSHIQRQTKSKEIKAYLSAAFNGTMDGLYLYAGLYILSTFIPPLAILVNVFSIMFAALSLLKSVYEEYNFQRKLKVSAYNAEKRLIESLPDNEKSIDRLNQIIKKLKRLNRYNYFHALGESVRDGLGVYAALTSILFATSIFTPIPFFIVLGAIGIGVVGLLGFAGYNLWQVYARRPQRENKFPDKTEAFGRAPGAGVKQKLSNFMLNGLQEKNSEGHYQNSLPMFIVSCIMAPILGLIYMGKALAKGFGKPSSDNLTSTQPNSPAGPGDGASPRMRPTFSSTEFGQTSTDALAQLSEPTPSDQQVPKEPPLSSRRVSFHKDTKQEPRNAPALTTPPPLLSTI